MTEHPSPYTIVAGGLPPAQEKPLLDDHMLIKDALITANEALVAARALDQSCQHCAETIDYLEKAVTALTHHPHMTPRKESS